MATSDMYKNSYTGKDNYIYLNDSNSAAKYPGASIFADGTSYTSDGSDWDATTVKNYTAEEIASTDPATLAVGAVVNNEGTALIKSGGEFVSVLNYQISVEYFGGVGDGTADDTVAFQSAVNTGKAIALRAGRTYKITDTVTCPSGFSSTRVFGNGAKIHTVFGTNYSKPLFKNDATTDATCRIELHDLEVSGNCMVVKQEFTADNPNTGLSLVINRLTYNSGDGNRRPGTGVVLASSIDFVDINKVVVWNADIGMAFGALLPKRSSTQVCVSNTQLSQVNSGMKIIGCDKVSLDNVDIMGCNSGFSFEGQNSRVAMRECHVESLATSASYGTPSTYVDAGASGIAYYFKDLAQNKDVLMEQCSAIDNGGTSGVAVAGIFIGRCGSTQANLQSIRMIDCNIAKTMSGSAAYKAIVNRGKFKWDGQWPYTTEVNLAANGLSYIDMEIKDSCLSPNIVNMNLFRGNTVLSLLTGTGTTAPTITEIIPSATSLTYGHKISFNSIYEMYQLVTCPYGWVTVDVIGYWISGNPLLYVQNNTNFTDMYRVQFNGAADTPRRWRICFFNPAAGQVYRIGVTNQSATAGTDQCVISSISAYQGLPRADYVLSDIEIVAALPAPSRLWYGKRMVVRAAGVADTMFVGVADSSVTNVFKQIALS